ncbi:MAG: hypothetical protein LC769_07130 [Chloroflexi bacterium]|nr:hypothetical protein [Chloroflexota bacterium]
MSTHSVLTPPLQRLLAGACEGAEHLTVDLQKAVRELSALSLSYSGHSIRAGMHDDALAALDAELGEAATALARILFELQQRLQLDVLTLNGLERIEWVVDLEDERPLPERLLDILDAYVAALGPRLSGMRTTVAHIAVRLAVLANNTEIAACRAGAGSGAAVELFMLVTARMRALAQRLRAIAEAMAVFTGTQEGYVEAVRAALRQRMDMPPVSTAPIVAAGLDARTDTGEAA